MGVSSGLRRQPVFVGVDTGGTFTDFVCLRGSSLSVLKLPSTPQDPAAAVLQGLRRLAGTGQACVCYGSTVSTNAILERRGARVALITTAGFEDLLEIGRQTRPILYTLAPNKPEPLVPRDRRFGVAERTLYDGSIECRLTAPAAADAARRAARMGAEAVAVCFLHAYANPTHERLVARALAHLDIPVSLSHELVREYREYERLSTTVINAYVAPVMGQHLQALERHIRGRLRVMQSSGGVVRSVMAQREPVRTILSGPAGGVIGAIALARRSGAQRIVTLDMGGTSTDVCLIDGSPIRRTETAICDLPVRVPAIDIHTVGAGGGSIARLDAGGALKVGPESAGADPGPACYGHGSEPTVTDANLVLGRLIAAEFLGGEMHIDPDRARRAVGHLAKRAGLALTATAEGIVRVVNAGMERAVRVISVERGFDPRDFTLVAFGGAAGLHACELAAALGFARVLIPPDAGLLSAWGMLTADLIKDYARSVLRAAPTRAELEALYRPLMARARRDMSGEGTLPRRVRFVRSLDLRYAGQSYEIEVPFGPRYAEAFHDAHRRCYGSADVRRPVEVVTARLRAIASGGVPVSRALQAAARATRETLRGNGARLFSAVPGRTTVYWCGRPRLATVHRRVALGGRPCRGPAVICEFSATTWVPPGWKARTDGIGNLLLERT